MKFKISVLFIFICVVVVVGGVSFCTINIFYPLKYSNYITAYSKEYQLDKSLVSALIYSESRFNKDARSSKGAVGLMQIMPQTAKSFYIGEEEFNEKMLYDPKINIKIGCHYLKYLFNKYKDEVTVLACYNAGEKAVNLWKGDNDILKISQIRYKETEKYVKKVLKSMKIYNLRLN